MKFKKLCFLLLLIITVTVSAHAQVVEFFTPAVPKFSVKQNVQFNFWPDSKEKGLGLSVAGDFDMKQLHGDMGVNFCNGNIDFTTQVIYWPVFFNRFNLGIGFTYHLFNYTEVFKENDFLFNVCFKMDILDWLAFSFMGGYFQKITLIDGFDKPVFNPSIDVNAKFLFYPGDNWTLYFQFSSYNLFNYPLFFSAMFSTGAEFDIVPGSFSTGLDLNTKFYDFIVNSQDCSQFNLVVYGRFKI